MMQKGEPSYTDLVFDVLRSAGKPLLFQELLEEVDRRRPITTKNPKATIRSALSQGKQLVSLGDGRYGYLANLLPGSLIRLPLTEKKPANHPLAYTEEVRMALWPGFFGPEKHGSRAPVQMRLSNGDVISFPLEYLGTGTWGCPMPEALRRFLVEKHAAAGDSLLIRALDGEAERFEASFESHLLRDRAANTHRNRELADAAYQILRKSPSHEVAIWDIAVLLLARGAFRAGVAPDPLEDVLKADSRFVDSGASGWILAEAVTPEVETLIHRRKGLDKEYFHSVAEPAPGTGMGASPLDFRRAMERTLADLGKMLAGRPFSSDEEANTFLREMVGQGGVPRQSAQSRLERAQDLMYDAWEATSTRERVRLAKKALEITPDCADAYVLLAEETARGPKEAAELYAKGVAAGERTLGKETFRDDVGYFWGLIETRPYMRARLGLAVALWEMGKRQDAIEHAWDMLRLNPGDNQGVRYVLLNWLLKIGDDAQAKRLFDLYRDDATATWTYGSALHAFRTEGDTPRARKLRADALKHNPHVPPYLIGRKRLPKSLPDMISFGDESEAVTCAAEQVAAWQQTPGALPWLAASVR